MSNLWLSFYPGAKIGIIGANGAGKSTILKIMASVEKEFDGTTWLDPDAKIGYLPQEPQLDENLTVRENVELGLSHIKNLLTAYDAVNDKFADPDADFDALINEQAELQDKIDAANGWDLQRTTEIAMDALRVPDPDGGVAHLSGGEKRRVALCALLLSKPDLLLLDEPTNHLDAESVAWLENHLSQFAGTVVFVTHDRYFLDNVAKWILEIDNGRGVPWEGNYSSWLDQKQKKMAEKIVRWKKDKQWPENSNGFKWEKRPESIVTRLVLKTMSNCFRELKAISNNEENGDRNPKWSKIG